MTLEIIHTLSSHVKGAKTGFAHFELLGQHSVQVGRLQFVSIFCSSASVTIYVKGAKTDFAHLSFFKVVVCNSC